jgi:hypothetical protein
MKFDELHPLNLKLVKHKKKTGSPAMASPDSHPDPYWTLGSHPEIVERVWDGLGGALPVDCRAIVYGTPGLVDPHSGVVLAMAYGTSYALRVPLPLLDEAYKARCTAEHEFSTGKINLETQYGRGWVFGFWLERELQWLRDVYDELQTAT